MIKTALLTLARLRSAQLDYKIREEGGGRPDWY